MPVAKPLSERLLSRHYPTFIEAVRECILAADAGDSPLATALLSVTKDRQVLIAATLGDMSGDAGTEALRKAFDSPGASRDLRCASILALAKRCGASASADYVRAFASSDSVVKGYALRCLAGAGDDRAWDPVLKRLNHLVGQPRHRSYELTDVAIAIGYLARHVLAAGSSRSITLIGWIRANWGRLTKIEHEWLADHWPGCAPNGGDPTVVLPPNAELIRQAVRGPLFDAPASDLDMLSGEE
jgi:hypothetical protein